jgi:hypothetical protein
MRDQMQEDAPTSIVQRCLEIMDDTPLADIIEILCFKYMNRGLDPGTAKGPQGWGWFPVIIANELQSRRDQTAAAEDPTRKTHWRDYDVAHDPEMAAMTSGFDTLDELEAKQNANSNRQDFARCDSAGTSHSYDEEL